MGAVNASIQVYFLYEAKIGWIGLDEKLSFIIHIENLVGEKKVIFRFFILEINPVLTWQPGKKLCSPPYLSVLDYRVGIYMHAASCTLYLSDSVSPQRPMI